MDLKERIESFVSLGTFLGNFLSEKERREDPLFILLDDAIEKSGILNAWYTRESTEYALKAWTVSLQRVELEKWLAPYASVLIDTAPGRNIAVIMAGNIPLVGFHDFLTVLLSDNLFTGRLSSDDTELLPALAGILESFNPEWKGRIHFTQEKLSGFDAVIATGSNNSSNYFNYYFAKYPHIIRKNRNGIAILTGEENEKELSGLADDIFLYYGLGCRNVSKLYFPKGYDVEPLFKAFHRYIHYCTHHKWMNNHDYYRSIFLLNQVVALDNGFALLTENKAIASPPSVIYYEYYRKKNELLDQLAMKQDELQVVVCKEEVPFSSCLPGQAQAPRLADYADGVDTLQFLLDLNK
jgi:hypothetical protein